MRTKLSYRRKIFVYFSIIITFFTVGIVLFEQHQLKRERVKNLENIMDIYAESVHSFVVKNNLYIKDSLALTNGILSYFPDDVRLTVIDTAGVVHLDNRLDAGGMENHLHRPEIQKAIAKHTGSNIRISASNNIKYLYYAKAYKEGYFVRIAMPYNLKVRSFLSSNNSFVYFIALFFLVSVFMMNYFANRFSRSIQQLRAFSQGLKNGEPITDPVIYADDEVGEISSDIIENYNLLQENRKKLATEREKLLQHFQYSEEGIAIFSKKRKKIYANSHFLQYLNAIADEPTQDEEYALVEPSFADVIYFLDQRPADENMFTKQIEKNGKKYNLRILIFDDKSFELYIGDITKAEKTRLLKQEMTNNIAHELRTPVTSIRGYIETIQELKADDVERRNIFLERAHIQTMRLSELIQDISLLTKIEEAPDRFQREAVNMKELLEELKSDLESRFREKKARFVIDMGNQVTINGSRTLLYSIFRNLAENSLAYAGEKIEATVRCYTETEDTYYFEFYDTGVGVEEKHLVRIFERFYRVNEGRTRNTGGSGLGLSIVKNAVLFHHGSIVAKKRNEGGLAFLITFPKATDNHPQINA